MKIIFVIEYLIYIDGKADNQIIKSFIQKDVSKEDSSPKKLFLSRYSEILNKYRDKIHGEIGNSIREKWINKNPGIRFSGHALGGNYSAGCVYILIYKLCNLTSIIKNNKSPAALEHETEEQAKRLPEIDYFEELEEILSNTRSYNYGLQRGFENFLILLL